MKLAVLGIDPQAMPLLRFLSTCGDHEVVAIHEGADAQSELKTLFPGAQWPESWESLLAGSVQGVIVCGPGDSDRRDDQLRKLVQDAVPLLVFHPACECMLGFELEMIRPEVDGVIMPYLPGERHPLLEVLRESLDGLGAIEQVVIERSLADRGEESVGVWLSRDIEMARRLLGEVRTVNAMQSTAAKESYKNLSVNLTTSDGVLVRWTVLPTDGATDGKMTVVGATEQGVLTMGEQAERWSLRIAGKDVPAAEAEADDEPRKTMEAFVQAIDGTEPDWSWNQACRNLEVVAAIKQSLKRGRTVELYGEEHTEEQSFKGVMAMGGCLLLLLGFFLMLGAALVDGLSLPFRERPDVLAHDQPVPRGNLLLRLWPFYPFLAFLLLQSLRLVFRSKTDSKNKKTAADDGAN